MTTARVLILPGYGDSGPGHWQTLWEARHGYTRVRQRSWDLPERAEWLAAVSAAIEGGPGPVALVAHSLACSLVAHLAATPVATRVVAALCVAPADVDSEMHTPDEVRGFGPMPMAKLPFPAVVVASRTDPYVRFVRAQQMAEAWGARLVDVGRQGHLNTDSGHGEWPEGHALLEELLAGS